MSISILFTCAGRRNYLIHYFRDVLGKNGQIYAADTNPDAPAMQEVDRAFVVPSIYNQSYISSLLSICSEYKVNILIPLNDLELPVLANVRADFSEAGTIALVSSTEVINTCFDKLETCQFSIDNGIHFPLTFYSIADAIKGLNDGILKFPLVVKPRWGTASIGIEICHDLEELKLAYRLIQKRLPKTILSNISSNDIGKSVLIQEFLHGQEYGLDIVNDLNGRYVCTFVKKKLGMRAGETDKAITVELEELSKTGALIGTALRHTGNLDCDLFITRKGIYLLEMNPRFGGGYPFSHVAGANIPAAIIAWVMGKTPDSSWFKITPGVTSAKCDRLVVRTVQ